MSDKLSKVARIGLRYNIRPAVHILAGTGLHSTFSQYLTECAVFFDRLFDSQLFHDTV